MKKSLPAVRKNSTRSRDESLIQRSSSKYLVENSAVTRWLANMVHSNGPVSSNVTALQLPFQRWFKFKEAFSPQFILDCAATFTKSPRSCLDPFGGSGTSALTSQFLGIRPTTIEVNPFLADLIEAKLSTYDVESLRSDYLKVLKISGSLRPSINKLLKDAPPTFVEPGTKERWIYSKRVAQSILALREAIALIESRPNQTLLKVILGSTLVGLSNVIVNGKGRKYRNGWEIRQKSKADVEMAFRSAFFDAFSDICHFASRPTLDFTLIRGDSREMLDEAEQVDFAVLSPPYPNSFDYTDIYNIELWMLGYLNSRPDNQKLRQETLRSHVQIHREYSTDTFASKKLAATYGDLIKSRDKLWSPHIPEMICAYFVDMTTILAKLKTRINRNGKVFLAVGNSQYAGVMIDAESILKDIALAQGFRKATSKPIRSMRASAQQGGRQVLTEALITLS